MSRFARPLPAATRPFALRLHPNRTHPISGGPTTRHRTEAVARCLTEPR